MKITKKINFRQSKYMIPALIYFPLLYTGYFFCGIFDVEPIESNNLETTSYLNSKLPSANLKGDGIGNKYENMLGSFGKIQDESAVENITKEEEKKEEYESQYSDAELAALDSIEENNTSPQLEELKAKINASQNQEYPNSSVSDQKDEENEELAELRKALAAIQSASDALDDTTTSEDSKEISVNEDKTIIEEEEKGKSNRAVKALDESNQTEEVVKKHDEASDYFNTINNNESTQKLIKAIVDEDIKAVEGTRVRLRLLDDIDVGERTLHKGSYLYCILSGFGQQRIKGNVTSVLIHDELVKINLSIYDMDGMEGLYVPKSSFRETAKDISSGALDQGTPFNHISNDNNLLSFGMQAVQNAYQKTTNAISKAIRKNKVKVKYGTHVYLINSKNIKNQ